VIRDGGDASLGPEPVLRELERILESAAFRGSKRCQRFLRYVVEEALAGRLDSLKERSLGIEVFERSPAYDTSEDAIVRVKANEVRKRLAQYYVEAGQSSKVRIELPAGSYSPEFHRVAEAVPSPPPLRRWRKALWTAAAALLLAAAFLGFYFRPRAMTRADEFWAPVMRNPRPVLLCSGNPVVYLLSTRVREGFRKRNVAVPTDDVSGKDIVPAVDQFIGVGNAHAAAQLSVLFARLGKESQIRIGNDTSFTDLRGTPAILIGAFSNAWTMEMTKDFRFVFELSDGLRMVRDRTTNKSWALPGEPGAKPAVDYAILSRVFQSTTGEVLISVAGITQYGTQAAGELLANPARLTEALQKAPAGWQGKDMQILLETNVIGRTPAAAKILEMHFW
jgi:hypothetical protein